MGLPAKKGTGFRCAVCGHVYRHEGMAERCIRTIQCRLYNAPPVDKRDIWRLVGGCGYVAAYFAYPVCDVETNAQALKLANAVKDKADAIFQHLFDHFPVAEHVRREIHDSIMCATARIWEPGKPVHMCYLGEVLTAVIHGAVGEAAARGYGKEELRMMRDISDAADALYEAYDPDNTQLDMLDRVLASINRLSAVIIGSPPAPRPLSLYMVDGWQLVAARGRDEARRVLARYGKTRPKHIEGIALGEKFEDGRTAADIIKGWDTPAIIGEVEA